MMSARNRNYTTVKSVEKRMFFCGISWRASGAALLLVEGDPTKCDPKKPWEIANFKKCKTSLNAISEALHSMLPENNHHCTLTGSDSAMLKSIQNLTGKLDKGHNNWICVSDQRYLDGISPQQYLPHILAAITDGRLTQSNEIDLVPLHEELSAIEFNDQGRIKSGSAAAEAFLYGCGEVAVTASVHNAIGLETAYRLGILVGEPRPIYKLLERF